MDLEQRVVELIHSSIDTTMQSMDSLVPRVANCAELIVQCLLSENKILCCGEGQSGAISQVFSSNLLNRFNYERPSLPALSLSADPAAITAITGDGNFNEIFSKQVRALGQSGDCLLVIANGSGSGTTLQAIQAAHDREMTVIAISDRDSSDIASLLTSEDIELLIPGPNRARVIEVQLLIINCLCDLIDQQLFGSEE
jgi:D-sedoheptulose 7-phosphate isomerase